MKLDEAIARLRADPEFIKLSPEGQQQTLDLLKLTSASSTSNKVAAALGVIVLPILARHYDGKVERSVIADLFSSAFDAFEAANVTGLFMELWPSAKDAPHEVLEPGVRMMLQYRQAMETFKKLAAIVTEANKQIRAEESKS